MTPWNGAIEWVSAATAAILGSAAVLGMIIKWLRGKIADALDEKLEPIAGKLDELHRTKVHDHTEMDERHEANAARIDDLATSHHAMRRALRALIVMLRTGRPDVDTRAMSDQALEELERAEDELDPGWQRRNRRNQ